MSCPEKTNVSVLFNEPKLLKYGKVHAVHLSNPYVSVLFNEPKLLKFRHVGYANKALEEFQCSSTSRNC